MKSRNGFTLIELLVVIAIIGILAAIIFPVYAQAKKSAYKSSDLSNMNSLRTALQLYKADNGAFPPALLGYVSAYENSSGGNIVPPNSIKAALYPKRVESLAVFRPALDRTADNLPASPLSNASSGSSPLVTLAYWPTVGNAYLNGGSTAPADMQKQLLGGNDLTHHKTVDSSGNCVVVPSYYYRISGYDVAPVSNAPGGKMESHYQLFWSAYAVSSSMGGTSTADAACSADASGSGSDTPRQLGYSDPPETTVVTWDPFFRDYQNGAPIHQKQDLVLFLAGNARPMDSANVATQAWATQP